MKTLSEDTDPKAEGIQIELIKKMSVYGRLQIAASLTKMTMKMTWDNLAERYPSENEESRLRRYILLLYEDPALADGFMRAWRKKNGKDDPAGYR
jgi:hypothetical protein